MPGGSSSATAGTTATAPATTAGSFRSPRRAARPAHSGRLRPGREPGRGVDGWGGPSGGSQRQHLVTVGNGSVYSSRHAYDNSDSVLELSPALALEQHFAPTSWPSDNAHDLDMSTRWALLANGQVVAAGKARIVYLLNGSSLGGIGGQQAQLGDACGSDIDGGIAVVGTIVYLPCLSGPIAVQASASQLRLHLLWRSSVAADLPLWQRDSSGRSIRRRPLRPQPVVRCH